MRDRLLASLMFGTLALMAALDAGLPLWRHLPIGDASDFAATAFFASYYTLKALERRAA